MFAKKVQKEIYLDNAAATPTDPAVAKEVTKYLKEDFANPSAFNDAGRSARETLLEARLRIARVLHVKEQEVILTGSGTEANNLAIFGIAGLIKSESPNVRHQKQPHIITTQIEHHSVLRPVQKLESEGVAVTYLPVNKAGFVSVFDLQKALRPETILISMIYANNEIGVIQPIHDIARVLKDFRNSKPDSDSPPLFHTDACQAAEYLNINPNDLGVDLMTLNSSKIYGPKGVGLLYKHRTIDLTPQILGGGQEMGFRSGTENVSLISGFAKALEVANDKKKKEGERVAKLRDFFIKNFLDHNHEGWINGDLKKRLSNNINLGISGIESEPFLLMLDQYGVRASAGAACSSKSLETSHVLKAIGLSDAEARSSLRFSLGRHTTQKDIEYLTKLLPELVKKFHQIYPEKLKKSYYV